MTFSKLDARAAIKLLKKWEQSKSQTHEEMQYIIQHALRTLIKQGNKEALVMLGYGTTDFQVQKFCYSNT